MGGPCWNSQRPMRKRCWRIPRGRAVPANGRHRASSPAYRTGAVDFAGEFHPEQSILSFAATPDYPGLWYLKEHYQRIRLFRNWSFVPYAELRKNQSAHDRADFLNESGTNLALVLSNFPEKASVSSLRLCRSSTTASSTSIFQWSAGHRRTVPGGGRQSGVPSHSPVGRHAALPLSAGNSASSRASAPGRDRGAGVGLAPGSAADRGGLLTAASERCQLIVTTHSAVLVDALTDRPESVVVCEKHDGQTTMQRLDKDDLQKWLKDYTLGNLWSSGQLGGNRW